MGANIMVKLLLTRPSIAIKKAKKFNPTFFSVRIFVLRFAHFCTKTRSEKTQVN